MQGKEKMNNKKVKLIRQLANLIPFSYRRLKKIYKEDKVFKESLRNDRKTKEEIQPFFNKS